MFAVPQLTTDEYSYAEAKKHAEALDHYLGFDILNTEQRIRTSEQYIKQDTEYWLQLDPQVLQTPYIEFRMILDCLKIQEGQCIVDLGAAYSRIAYVVGKYFPFVQCKTYEVIEERVAEARRVFEPRGYTNIEIHHADLFCTSFKLPVADYYFIYDFGSKRAIQKTIEDLKGVAEQKNITVIGRGRAVRDIIEKEEPWLSQVYAPEHFKGYSFYFSFPKS